MNHQLGTVAEEFNISSFSSFNNAFDNILITFTDGVDHNLLYSKISTILSNLEKSKEIKNVQLDEVSSMIELLEKGSENYLECSLRLRSLRERLPDSNKVVKPEPMSKSLILETINQSSDVNELENALIELGVIDFINVGKEGRKKIVNQFVNQRNHYDNLDQVIDTIQKLTNELVSKLANIEKAESVESLTKAIEELELIIYQSLSERNKKKVINKLFENKNRSYKTIPALEKQIRIIMKKIEDEDEISSVVDIDSGTNSVVKIVEG